MGGTEPALVRDVHPVAGGDSARVVEPTRQHGSTVTEASFTIAPSTLIAIGLAYLALLFLIAHATDANWLPLSLVSNSLVYSLSLGVYATSWTYYGSVGLADTSGYAFLTIYLGVTGAFLLGPKLLAPLLALAREHQLTSIADLLAFRYGGRVSGVIVTVFMLVGILPYLSLQIRAVTESLQLLTGRVPAGASALGFCVVIVVFSVLFGARHLSPREKHRGLVVAIAFESAVKLIALLVAGAFVMFAVFDSPQQLGEWASEQPQMLNDLYAPTGTHLWPTLLLLAFSAAFLLPRQYHMAFVENEKPAHLRTAYWLFPLYLLLLNLPIIPILFAGRFLDLNAAGFRPDFYVIGIATLFEHQWLAILIFVGGLSAASAMMIVTTLALSSMALNHLLLPASLGAHRTGDVYRRILWSKRLVITAIVAAAFAFYIVIELNEGLASLGLISFVAAAQLLPGTIALLLIPRATQSGFIAGLCAGALVWFVLLILPLLIPTSDPLVWFPLATDIWTLSTFCSLSANIIVFALVSVVIPATKNELIVGELTAQSAADVGTMGLSPQEVARSGVHYRYAMQEVLGTRVASEEFQRALDETGLDHSESRAPELRLLHDRLERNLTGLVGPTIARRTLRPRKPRDSATSPSDTNDVRVLELRLEVSRERMRGLTRQLDDLRRYLGDVLRDMPVGVCSIAGDDCVHVWNRSLARLTGIDERSARNLELHALPSPWGDTLATFAASSDTFSQRVRVDTDTQTLTVNLHKANVGMPAGTDDSLAGQVILVEDRTNLDLLESELVHTERLASVGRLAAGVAHEIGNPLTGIASLAQNVKHDIQQSDAQAVVPEQADDILKQVERIDTIVRSLLGFSHAGGDFGVDDASLLHVDEVIDDALKLVRLSSESRDYRFVTEIADKLVVKGNRNELSQVFVNLLNNACHASSSGAEIRISAREDSEYCHVSVQDEGPGIAANVREQVFDPFFTTKEVGEGTGLGLSIVHGIVTKHKGRVRIEDREKGATIIVSLPRVRATTGSPE